MRNLLILFAAALTFTQTAYAGFRVPYSVYKMNKIEDAKAEAKRTGQSLVIVYSDPKTKCNQCAVTSAASLKAFKKAGVVVFANSKKDGKRLPSGVWDVRGKSGRFIPMVFVLSADGKKGKDAFSYHTLKDSLRRVASHVKKDFSVAVN